MLTQKIGLANKKLWLRIAIGNFFLAACIGALLRFAFVVEIPGLNYRNLLHAHSHVAMLGWVYIGFFIFFTNTFVPPSTQQKKGYTFLFWLTQFTVIGMLISFSLQGYAAFSITFSSLHIICSYVFAIKFWKDTRSRPNSPAFVLAKTAIGLMLLSTVSLWAMGPIMALGFMGKPIYYLAVQFYLHFQFNGWFIFGALALFFAYLEKKQLPIFPAFFNKFYFSLLISSILAFALYIAWAYPRPFLFVLNSIAVGIQLVSLVFLFKLLRPSMDKLRERFSTWSLSLSTIVWISYLLKIVFQGLLLVPYIATISYTIRNYTIGFFHLLLLGLISCFLLAYGEKNQLLNFSNPSGKLGVKLLVVGFILSELVLFAQGTLIWAGIGFMPYYYEILFSVSLLLPIGIGFLLSPNIYRNKAYE